MRKIGLTTGLRYSWHVLDVLKVFDRANVSQVEIWGDPRHADLTNPRLINRLRRLQRDSTMNLAAVHPPARDEWEIDVLGSSRADETFDLFRLLIDHCLQLGVEILVLHPGEKRPDDEREKYMALEATAAFIDRVLEFTESRPVKLCVENTLPHHVGGRLPELKWLDQHTSRDFHLTLDTSHAFLSDSSILDYIDEFGRRIRHVHLSDNHGETDDHLQPGQGRIDFATVLKALQRQAYLDCWLLEVIHSSGGANPAEECRKIIDDFDRFAGQIISDLKANKISK